MKVSNSIRHLLAVAIAGSVLAACSAPPTGFVPASGTSKIAAVVPLNKLCEPIVYVGVGWQYVGGTVNEWFEWDGDWTYQGTQNHTLVPCAGDILLWSGTLHPCCPWYGATATAVPWYEQSRVDVVTVPQGNSIGVVKVNSRTTSLLETISVSPYTPTGVAVSQKGTLYVAVVPPSGGSETSCIIMYPKGSSSSSGMLNDASMAQNAAQIAVDRRDDVFATYTVSASGTSNAQIDEFPAGSTKGVPFATIKGVQAGAIATTKSGDVLVSTIGTTGQVIVLNPKGTTIATIPTTANPTSISLDPKNKALTVSDSTSNLVTTYAFPSGKQTSQSPMGTPSQTWEPGQMLGP